MSTERLWIITLCIWLFAALAAINNEVTTGESFAGNYLRGLYGIEASK